MDNRRNANERMILATLQAQGEAETSSGIVVKLRELVSKLEASEIALQKKKRGI